MKPEVSPSWQVPDKLLREPARAREAVGQVRRGTISTPDLPDVITHRPQSSSFLGYLLEFLVCTPKRNYFGA